MARVVDPGEDEATALVEGGDAALGVRREVALRRVRVGDNVGGVVDRMRPGIAHQKFILRSEALLQVDTESVIAGGSRREVRRHVAEGHRKPLAKSIRKHNLAGKSNARTSPEDRKSTRLNSSHLVISYAVFCL